MRKLLVALALAATLSPGVAGAASYLGSRWSAPHAVRFVRSGVEQDTVSFSGTLAPNVTPDTVRTAMIDLTGQTPGWAPGMDWTTFVGPSNSGTSTRHAIKVKLLSYGGVGTDTLPDTLWCNTEHTFDGGSTYALNTTVATTSSFALVRDITSYEDNTALTHPGVYVGYIDQDTDLSPTASQASGGMLWLRQFRLRIVPGPNDGVANKLSRGPANCRLFVQYPEPNILNAGGPSFAGIEIARKQVWFMKGGSLSDTLFLADETDTSRTADVDVSDAYVANSLLSAAGPAPYNAIKITLVATGANNGIGDSVYVTPLELQDTPTLGTYPGTSLLPTTAASIGLVRTSLAGNCPATFVGYMKIDADAAVDAANGNTYAMRRFKFFINGDVGGVGPKLATCKMYVSYPRARATYQ